MYKKLILLCFVFLFALIFVNESFSAEKPERITVVYGGSSWVGHAPVWVGIKKGIFRDKGLGVLFQSFYASSGRMGALITGDVDFASTGCISAIALMAVGSRDFYAFGTQDSYATVEGLIVKDYIKSMSDLVGKKIAVTFASSGHVFALDILEQYNLTPEKDVYLINLKVNDMAAAMNTGEVDACIVWTPHFNKILNMPGNVLLINETEFSLYKKYGLGAGPDLLVVRKKFLEKYPNTCKAFIEGYFEAVELIIDKPRLCAKLLIELTGLSIDEQTAVLKELDWFAKGMQEKLMINPGNFVEGMQRLAEFLVRHKQIDKVPTVKEWIYEDLVPRNGE